MVIAGIPALPVGVPLRALQGFWYCAGPFCVLPQEEQALVVHGEYTTYKKYLFLYSHITLSPKPTRRKEKSVSVRTLIHGVHPRRATKG